MEMNKIAQILRQNPNFSFIWIPSSEKQHKKLLYRLNNNKSVKSVRGVMMIGEADNRLSNAEQRASATILEKNVSAERFDRICTQLPIDLWGRIYC